MREILNKIDELLSAIDGFNIDKSQKLKLLRLSLELKLKLLNFFKLLNSPEKTAAGTEIRKRKGNNHKNQEIILNFIRQKGGKASSGELRNLGFAGRSLRRYLKGLRDSGKILIDQKGRKHFYSIIS